MARIYIFGDESGNFDFSDKRDATKHFLVSTVTMRDCSIGKEMLDLKRDMHWRRLPVRDYLHATRDTPEVRAEVYDLIIRHAPRVDATILQKNKVERHLSADRDRFYKMAWYLHLKFLIPQTVRRDDEVWIAIASVGVRNSRKLLHEALKDVMKQVSP